MANRNENNSTSFVLPSEADSEDSDFVNSPEYLAVLNAAIKVGFTTRSILFNKTGGLFTYQSVVKKDVLKQSKIVNGKAFFEIQHEEGEELSMEYYSGSKEVTEAFRKQYNENKKSNYTGGGGELMVKKAKVVEEIVEDNEEGEEHKGGKEEEEYGEIMEEEKQEEGDDDDNDGDDEDLEEEEARGEEGLEEVDTDFLVALMLKRIMRKERTGNPWVFDQSNLPSFIREMIDEHNNKLVKCECNKYFKTPNYLAFHKQEKCCLRQAKK